MFEALSRWNRWGRASLEPGIPRKLVAEVVPFLETSDVVAFVGPRRAGKSTVMYQVIDSLVSGGASEESILHINLEEPGLGPYLNPELLDRLYASYRDQVYPTGRAYVFLDEVQRVPEWERWVRSRNETEDVKLFVTGSSSALLSGELGTLLTGRHVTFTVYPLSFAEFTRFVDIDIPDNLALSGPPPALKKGLQDYLKWGGFPEVTLSDSEVRKERLLKQYFDDVLFKDVAMRHRVRDIHALRALAVTLMSDTANLISSNRLAARLNVSQDLAASHCGYLEEAFLAAFLPFCSLKLAERARRPQKVHALDTGLRNAVCLTGSPDHGRVAESAVWASLSRAPDAQLFYWKGKQEVDLAIRRGTKVDELIQVTYGGPDQQALKKREVASLQAAARAFPAARLTLIHGLSSNPTVPPDINAVPLWRFLLEN